MAVKNLLKNILERNSEASSEVLDTVKDLGKAVADETKNELGEAWKAYLKMSSGEAPQKNHGGDLKEGEEISFKKEKAAVNKEAAIDYHREILHSSEKNIHKENAQYSQQLEEIRAEIANLSKASKELETTFRSVAAEKITKPVNPGKYHLTFGDWLITSIKSAIERIESSSAALSIMRGKVDKGYWANAQKSGTSYTLSGERAVSQQVG